MKISNYIKYPPKILLKLDQMKIIRLSDKKYLKYMYKSIFNRKLDLKHPKTFNEKIQYLKLYDRNDKYTNIVDKYKVKEIVSKIIGEEYIIPTIGVWDNANKINFDELPNSFVLKCNHDSGSVIICKNKKELNIDKTIKYLNKKVKKNFYYNSREWPYKNVKPLIIAEKYLGDNINDYKIQCFNGEVDNIMICDGRFTQRGVRYYYFDSEWKYLPYCQYDDIDPDNFTYPKPSKIDELIQLSKVLSKKYNQIRVDWYVVNNKIYFGELTFYTNSGFDDTITYQADLLLGDKLVLGVNKNEN